MKYNLEISAAAAILAITVLAVIIPMFPDQWMIGLAVLLGWFIGVFHGILGEMRRNRKLIAARRLSGSLTMLRARAWWQFLSGRL